MDRIRVAISETNGQELMDLELPMNQRIFDLIRDINQTIEAVNQMKTYYEGTTTFAVERTGKKLDREKTLEEEHVWNGDKLIITSL